MTRSNSANAWRSSLAAPARRVFERNAAGQTKHTVLRAVINRDQYPSREAADGRAVDDRAVALLSHLQGLVFHARPHAALIDGVHPVVILGRPFCNIGGWNLDAGIIEGGVQAAEKVTTVLSNMAATWASSDTSHTTAIASPPAALISSTAFRKAFR